MEPPTKSEEEEGEEESIYHSDMFAMIGTLFLWMFWPSFNGALAGDQYHQQERVVINTVLALTCSCISAFFWSHFYCGRLDMVHIQNASLAGGVAVGSSSDLVVGPYAAIIIGLVGGCLSVSGYVMLTPRLNKLGIYDVCGINNLHGMPGILGGVAGAISAARSHGRSASDQGWYQAATLGVTLLFSIGGGVITGGIVNAVTERKRHLFQDIDTWELPHSGYANTTQVGAGTHGKHVETVEMQKDTNI